jgi:hypothetical protein
MMKRAKTLKQDKTTALGGIIDKLEQIQEPVTPISKKTTKKQIGDTVSQKSPKSKKSILKKTKKKEEPKVVKIKGDKDELKAI